ncbi:MAG: acyl-[ACP]--phospholipid O-acyltransferase [Candidatus Sumerlaeia bacterium]
MTDPTRRSERGFWHLVVLQFQGAFSDNVLKQLIILGMVAVVYQQESKQSQMNGVVSGVFVLPGMLISIWAGYLADKFSKRTVTLVTKSLEIITMLLATAVFMSGDPHKMLLPSIAVLFLLSNQFTLFSPTKYGIIPELVTPRRLSWANGVIELTTFVAIIMGTGVVPLLLNWVNDPTKYHFIGFGLVGLASIGLLAGFGIDRTTPANPSRPFRWNFIPEFITYIRVIVGNRTLFLVNLGLCYFWFIGILVLTHINVWGQHSLALDNRTAGLLYFLLSLGIGLGAFVAGYLSHGKVELGLVPLGGIGMSVFSFPMAFATPETRLWMYFCVFMVGVSAGFFSLPLNAMLQHYTKIEERGVMIAANNFFNAASMVLASVFLMAFNELPLGEDGAGPPANYLFFIGGLMSLGATIFLLKLLPDALLRFVGFMITSTFYRIRALGLENLPKTGGVLLMCNHVSYIDALLLGTACPRPVRFIAYSEFFNTPILGYFLKATRSIPISPDQKPRELIRSLKVASDALKAGDVVCIFPEGQLTRTGQMNPFHRGYELILKEAPVPVVAVYLDGVWGSIFSFKGQKFFWKKPRQTPYPIRIAFGEPLPPDSSPFTIRQKIQELGADAAIAARHDRQPLDRLFVDSCRQSWKRFAMLDPMTPALNWGKVLAGTVALAREMAGPWTGQARVGVLLPPSVAGALTNFAATITGRAAINLNYTIGQETLEHCARESEIKTVVTSRKFLEKTGLKPPAEPIFIEDHLPKIGKPAKVAALLAARLMPRWVLARYCLALSRPKMDDLATIIFSSGSTGVPKGVPLTHFNVVSNICSFSQAFSLYPEDRLLGTLPFFHSFGYTVSLWGAAVLPFGCIFHHNPLDAKTVGELAHKERATLIITTPTFLQLYSRRVPPAQFGGLSAVVTGAERLPDSVAEEFERQFGIFPLQGFGTTECSPAVAVNVPDHRSPGLYQIGHKRGSIGHPLPGIAVKTLDPETGEPTGPGQPGLLWVKGANVMGGYLNLPEKSAEVLQGGWYNTGDMAYIDEDGFIFITGRLSRFSKIGGEMVPHVGVEDKLRTALELTVDEQLVVAAVNDEKKGERLVVIHNVPRLTADYIAEKLAGATLPNLWIPKRENFYQVETIPLLGTGKLDLRALQKMANELAK